VPALLFRVRLTSLAPQHVIRLVRLPMSTPQATRFYPGPLRVARHLVNPFLEVTLTGLPRGFATSPALIWRVALCPLTRPDTDPPAATSKRSQRIACMLAPQDGLRECLIRAGPAPVRCCSWNCQDRPCYPSAQRALPRPRPCTKASICLPVLSRWPAGTPAPNSDPYFRFTSSMGEATDRTGRVRVACILSKLPAACTLSR